MPRGVDSVLRTVIASLLLLATLAISFAPAMAMAHGPESASHRSGLAEGPGSDAVVHHGSAHEHVAAAEVEAPDCSGQHGTDGATPCCFGTACILMHSCLPGPDAPPLPTPPTNSAPGFLNASLEGLSPDPGFRPPRLSV